MLSYFAVWFPPPRAPISLGDPSVLEVSLCYFCISYSHPQGAPMLGREQSLLAAPTQLKSSSMWQVRGKGSVWIIQLSTCCNSDHSLMPPLWCDSGLTSYDSSVTPCPAYPFPVLWLWEDVSPPVLEGSLSFVLPWTRPYADFGEEALTVSCIVSWAHPPFAWGVYLSSTLSWPPLASGTHTVHRQTCR